MHTQGEEVAAENLDLHYVSSPTGRSYSPSQKMHSLEEALPDTVSFVPVRLTMLFIKRFRVILNFSELD